VLLFLGTGAGMAVFFRYEKARMERRRIAEASKGVGKPKVGGPFELVDQDGRGWDSEVEMRGRFGLVSGVEAAEDGRVVDGGGEGPRSAEAGLTFRSRRSTLASRTARTSARKSSTRWPT
jgi:hypothetical protein